MASVSRKTKKNHSKYSKLRSLSKLRAIFLIVFLNIIFLPSLAKYETQALNRYTISVNGVIVGVTDSESKIRDFYREARCMLAESASGNMVFVEVPDISCEASAVITGRTDSDEVIINNMYNVLSESVDDSVSKAYYIKVGDENYTLKTTEDVLSFFEDAISKYDVQNTFDVSLGFDTSRELSVLSANIYKKEVDSVSGNDVVSSNYADIFASAGFESDFTYDLSDIKDTLKTGFDKYDYGIESIDFSKNIEIVEAYIDQDDVMDLAYVEDILLNEQEVQQVYEVVAGDTLSGISLKVNLPMDALIEMNSALENEYSVIVPGQELVITVPEPALSIIWTEQAKLEEAYNLPTEYIYNDSWFTTDSVTLQQPSAGYHEAVLLITHENAEITDKETVYEVVIAEPTQKIVEVGTIVPPTYIKPLAGGRISSYFGYRSSPGGIGSTYHKGIDWATPTGTPIYASCGGTVTSAGWRGGYGYCIDISHPDGKTTRYAHLSKIYVSAGQQVSQGQVIAASGSTGNSTGPHLHFEIIIGGTQVNPLNYL